MYLESNDELNELLAIQNAKPDLVSIWEVRHRFDIAKEVDALVASVNSGVSNYRKLPKTTVLEVLDRVMEKNATAFSTPEVFQFLVMRELSDFASSYVSGKKPTFTNDNNDLLPLGHPECSSDTKQFSDLFVQEHKIEWKSSDPRISEEFRPLVASAMRAPADSLERTYVLTQLEATSSEDVPRDLIISIINDNQ
jgi:hypothetical protein